MAALGIAQASLALLSLAQKFTFSHSHFHILRLSSIILKGESKTDSPLHNVSYLLFTTLEMNLYVDSHLEGIAELCDVVAALDILETENGVL